MIKNAVLGIVIPSYNQANFIRETLESCSQIPVNVQLVVLDGGSTDGSVEIIKRYQRNISYWRSEQDGGQSAAINEGVRRLSTEYVTWLNSDDILVSSKMQSLVNVISRKKPDIVYGNHFTIDAGSRVIGRHYHPPWARSIVKKVGPYIPQPGTFIRREKWSQAGCLREDLHCTMDTEFWLRLDRSNCSFLHFNGYISGFRIHPKSKGESWKARYAQEYEILKQEYGFNRRASKSGMLHYYSWKYLCRLLNL